LIEKVRSFFFFFCILFLITLLSSGINAEEMGYEVVSEGFFPADNNYHSMVIKEKDTLDKILKQQGVDTGSISIDLKKETLALIVPDKGSYPGTISIEDINKNGQKLINVNYYVNSVDYVPEKNEELRLPYKLIKIFPAGSEYTSVSFRRTNSTSPVFVNNSVENIVKYTNVLEDNRENLFLNYLPLDKGNSWTYDFESPRGKGSQTFSIVSYTNGWSIFDTYFGKNNLALRLDRGGYIHVSSETGNRPFYTPDVLVSYPKETYKSGTTEFDNIMVVRSNDNSNIEFKDIYARDIGLIYHEHKSDKGISKYSLTNAYVRGKQIP